MTAAAPTVSAAVRNLRRVFSLFIQTPWRISLFKTAVATALSREAPATGWRTAGCPKDIPEASPATLQRDDIIEEAAPAGNADVIFMTTGAYSFGKHFGGVGARGEVNLELIFATTAMHNYFVVQRFRCETPMKLTIGKGGLPANNDAPVDGRRDSRLHHAVG